jgi:hypothetical protein
MKMYYEIEGAELIVNTDGSQESGDTIIKKIAKTEKNAKKIGEQLLKNNRVLSVWIRGWKCEKQDGDPLCGFNRYKSDIKWNIERGW